MVSLLLGITVPSAVFVWLVMPSIVGRVLPGYQDGLAISSLVLFVVPARTLSSLCGAYLLAVDRSIESVHATAVIAVIGALMQVVCVPLWGLSGAVFAAIATEALSVALLFRAVRGNAR
jgi:O-antigen/teichoic acid export membrane protein